jgi:hypothetical protein
MPQFQPGNQLAKNNRLYVTELIIRKLDEPDELTGKPIKEELVNALFKLAMGVRLLKKGHLLNKTEPNLKALQEIINRCEGKVPVRIDLGVNENQDLLEVIERVVVRERARANGSNGHLIDITPEAEEAEDRDG